MSLNKRINGWDNLKDQEQKNIKDFFSSLLQDLAAEDEDIDLEKTIEGIDENFIPSAESLLNAITVLKTIKLLPPSTQSAISFINFTSRKGCKQKCERDYSGDPARIEACKQACK